MTERTFVALAVPGALAQGLQGASERLAAAAADTNPLPSLRWIQPRQYHVTLCFLGDTTASQRAQVEALLAVLPLGAPLTLPIAPRVHAFGGEHAAQALVARLEGGDEAALRMLKRRLADALEPLGFPKESRAYVPHITLARLKRQLDVRHLASAASLVGPDGAPLSGHFTELVYYRSTLTAEGGVYQALLRRELGLS